GETQLADAEGNGANVRTIHFSGDAHEALAEIERIWPQLSKSPLRVLRTPGRLSTPLRRLPAELQPPDGNIETPPPAAPPAKAPVEAPAVPPEVKTAEQEGSEPKDVAPAEAAEAEPAKPEA